MFNRENFEISLTRILASQNKELGWCKATDGLGQKDLNSHVHDAALSKIEGCMLGDLSF